MNTSSYSGSAQIYEFPKNPRAAAVIRHRAIEPTAKPGTPQIGDTILGGAWYHEEALGQADQATKA